MTSVIDHGTPARPGLPSVDVEIDGTTVTVTPGTSIMRAAAQAGISVPRLCATESLEPFGSCRLCLVEVDGRPGTPASCTTPCTAGMRVHTQTPRLDRLRRGVLELYLTDHPLTCHTCSANGDCELQDMVGTVGLRDIRYGIDRAGESVSHAEHDIDASNPYFRFDPSTCITCSRCVRACGEVQGTFALTISGRGHDSAVTASAGQSFLDSECVSCGACVAACPTSALQEKSVIDLGVPTRRVATTCAYCGVGCSFIAELRGDELVRMVPDPAGGANAGHSCVKGRFAWGYATHPDRVTTPMIRESIEDPWREVTWDEAIGFAADRLSGIRRTHGPDSIGGITSSRCTNEEVYVVAKMVRAAFGTNNVDTCARVCHSPTGYGLKQTFGTSAGTQDFASVAEADVIVVIGANPTDAHPVFASRMKRRLREGAQLIVIDPRRIGLVESPHIRATEHLRLRPGTNVAVVNAMAHVIAQEGLIDRAFVRDRCDPESFAEWEEFIRRPENSPEALAQDSGVPADAIRRAARLYASAPNAAIYYGLGVTEHSQGSTMVMAMANLAMATGNIGRPGVGVNPLRGQNNVQGSCDMGSFPHELSGYRHVSDDAVRAVFEEVWGAPVRPDPGMRIPNMLDSALSGTFRGLFVQGEDLAQSDPHTEHVTAALEALDCLIVQDLFLNETARFAHVFLPGTSFLEKDGTFTNAERRINRVRPVMASRTGRTEWEVACALATALGYPLHYDSAAQIMDEIAAVTPTFSGVSYALLDEVGSVQWPCTPQAPRGTPIMHVDTFARGAGRFVPTPYVPTLERSTRRYPLLLTTGRILSQYNVGAQTRRTANVAWHDGDVLDLHPADAELRGVTEGSWVELASRAGSTVLRARITEDVPAGVVYTTFHFPVSGVNVVTTENSDWATNCPEYKVTAVEVRPHSPYAEQHDDGQDLRDHPDRRARLVAMVDQIAASVPDRQRAAEETAAHLRAFWPPRMIADLREVAAADAAGLSPTALDALALLAD